ncbi:MAG: hypothetical protein U0800_12780 [Isosphaeraceae bacterium]
MAEELPPRGRLLHLEQAGGRREPARNQSMHAIAAPKLACSGRADRLQHAIADPNGVAIETPRGR